MNLITADVATNIAAHAQQAWHYGLPNDEAAEVIICNGLDPFYVTEHKGGSTTIVDAIATGTNGKRIALDIKSRQVLKTFLKAPGKGQLASANSYQQVSDGVYVGKPPSVMCPVRRPKVDLQGYKGNCESIITEQIREYADYAKSSIERAECDELHSIVLLYGEHNGYKAIYIEEQPFDTPVPTSYTVYTNKKGEASGYEALDEKGQLLYKLMDYSEGSTNFNKRFDCNGSGYLFVWPGSSLIKHITSPADWLQAGNFMVI